MVKPPTPITQNLIDLFSVLNNKEKNLVEEYLASQNETPLIECFNTLKYNSDSLYKENKTSLFQSLYNNILEILLLDRNIKQTSVYEFMNVERLYVRKWINHMQFIAIKGKLSLIIAEYKNIIEQARRHELYDELLIFLYELLNIYSSNNKYEEYKQIEEEISYYENLRTEVKTLFRLFNKYTLEINLFAEDKTIIHSLGEELNKLSSKISTIKSRFGGGFIIDY